jgi:hypothetical protein
LFSKINLQPIKLFSTAQNSVGFFLGKAAVWVCRKKSAANLASSAKDLLATAPYGKAGKKLWHMGKQLRAWDHGSRNGHWCAQGSEGLIDSFKVVNVIAGKRRPVFIRHIARKSRGSRQSIDSCFSAALFWRQRAGSLQALLLAISPLPRLCFFVWPEITNRPARCVGPRNGAAHLKRWQTAPEISKLFVGKGRARCSY